MKQLLSLLYTVIQKCEFHRDNCEAGIDGLLAWEYSYNEESGVFSREPLHNWASHPSDAFAYGCQVMQESVAKEPETPPIHAVKGHNGRIITATLDQLWAETPKRMERI